MTNETKTILVVGGGIAGITAALEAAEVGHDVVLVERNSYLGGRVAQMFRYFPKLCPPSCGLEINFRRIKTNPRLTVLTGAEVESLTGSPGNYEVTVKVKPRYVTDACTLCDDCAKACPAERDNDFNYGLSKTKAAYLPHEMAFPQLYAIERQACPDGCSACKDACRRDGRNAACPFGPTRGPAIPIVAGRIARCTFGRISSSGRSPRPP